MKRRHKLILATGTVAAGLLFGTRAPLQQAAFKWSVFHNVSPTEEAMTNVLEHSGEPVTIARQIWDMGEIVPRMQLLQCLRRHAVDSSPLWPGVRPIALEAARSGDIDLEQSALGLLERQNDPAAPIAAAQMLQDPDPEIRQIGIFYSSRSGDKRFVPLLVPVLDDPDRRIQGCAQGALCTLTGQDFGVQFDADRGISQAEIAAWKHWWAQHHEDYPGFDELKSTPLPAAPGGKARDFSLFDLDRSVVHLTDFRGKTVVLSFWAKREPDCLKQVPQWMEFQRRHPEVTVLAVSLDALPDEHHHAHGPAAHEHMDMHDHEGMHKHEGMAMVEDDPQEDGEDVAVRLQHFAARNHLNYRVLIDRSGQTSLVYGADDPPICVWIDRDGTVRRRMRLTGSQAIAALESVAHSMSATAEGTAMSDTAGSMTSPAIR